MRPDTPKRPARSSEIRGRAQRLACSVVIAFSVSVVPRSAAASHCEPHPYSSCIPSNQQWLAAAPSHFAAIPSAEVLGGGSLSLALASVYQHEPLTLEAPSPDPEGRQVPLVEHVVDTQVLFAAGLGYGFEFTSALRLVAYQQGSGIGVARSRSESSLASNAIRDPLFGVAYTLFAPQPPTQGFAMKLRSDVSLPLGDPESFASEPGSVLAPALTFQWEGSRFNVSGDLGLRLRPSATLADVRYGDQLSLATGLSVEVLREMLFVAAEATALPGLESSRASPDGAKARWIPAEWAVTLSLYWSEVYSLMLSAGGGLPLSSRTGGTEDTIDAGTFVGLGAPRFRSLLVLRVTSPSDE